MMDWGFYRPADVQAANDCYGASCGHAALAAILGQEVREVWRAARHVFEGRPYVSAPAMEDALRALRPGNWRQGASDRIVPVRGLALLQFEGPWMAPGLPFGAQLAHTHWIAVDRAAVEGAPDLIVEFIYDVNQDGWKPRKNWQNETLPLLLGQHKRSIGWHVRRSYEVQPMLLSADARTPSPT